MKQLMTHVERIVRPVAAFAPRKLRMRRELLAHLQQAAEEESGKAGGDVPAAVGRAMRRLGEPAELTRQLRQSVPLAERLLMAKLPIPRRLEQAEQWADATIYGSRGKLTLGHQVILVLLAGPLAGLPGYTPKVVRDVLTHAGSVAHPALFFCCVLSSICVMLALSFRLVSAAADPVRPVLRPGVIALIAALLAMQVAYPFIVARTAADRLPTMSDLSWSIGITAVLLLCALLLARWVARLRPLYDEWLQLDLAS
jgi:hypothetical protein